MKHLHLPIVLAIAAQFAFFGAAHAQERAVLRVNEKVHNFGRVKLGAQPSTTFIVTSAGNEPVALEDAHPTCGCAKASYTKTPMRKGETGRIRVTFNAAALGPFKVSIIVSSNAADAHETLFITGRVVR